MSPATYSSAKPSTPLGIKIICVLGGIGGVLGLFGSLAMFGISPILGLFALVLSIVQIVVVFGLWELRSWAWTLAMISYAIGLVFDLIGVNIIGLLIGIVLIAYLSSKSHLFR